MSDRAGSLIRILHVDDDPSLTNLTRKFLEREDDRFTAETATSADEGLERINDHPPDCVVSDYNMPGMNGIEFLRAVREEYPDLPFILFTGKGSEAVASDAVSAGVTDYLQKQGGTEQYELLANRIQNVVTARWDAEESARQEDLMRRAEVLGATGGWELWVESEDLRLTDGIKQIYDVEPGRNLSLEEVIAFYEPDSQQEVRSIINDAIEDGHGEADTLHLRTANGEKRVVEGNAELVETEGDSTVLRGVIHDITDRKERERKLAQTYDLMTNMEQLAGVGAWEYNPDTETLLMTGGVCRVHGFDPDADPTLEEAFASFHPDDRGLLRDRFDTCLETGEPYDVDVRLTTPDGGEKWVTARGERVTADGSGSVVRGYTQDITEQKQLERDLRKERDIVSGILEAVPVGLSVVDGDGSISFVNERLKSICGRSLEELEEMSHDDPRHDLVDEHGEPLDSGETPFNRVASRETAIHNQVMGIRRPSGERVWLSVSGAPQYDNGQLERAVFALEDITEQRELQRELGQIKTIAESLKDAVYVLNDDGQFVYVNDELSELTGYSRETILGSTPELIKDEETAETAEQQLGMLLSDTGPDTVTFETTIQPDSGSPVVCEDHMGVLPYEGDSFNGSVGVLRDITEHKRRERELRQERNRLDEFASVVSHDLRNPLTVAEGRLELAQESCESSHLAQAAEAIDRSQALIEDLLTLAREGEGVSEVEPVALADAAERSWQTVESRSATLEAHATRTLQADRSRLKQLFENLYRNAIEHGGDDVTVSVGPMDDGFYVADTGPGIPESGREEVFEAGYSTSEGGTGFGLRIVEQVADAHGWEVAVTESEQGGARLEITGVEFADQ